MPPPPPLSGRDQLGRPYVVLQMPSLAPDTYVLALSHGWPGTGLQLFLPAGATMNGALTSEDFLRRYLPSPTDDGPPLRPADPVLLHTLASADGTVRISFQAEAGLQYGIEAAHSLTLPRWQILPRWTGRTDRDDHRRLEQASGSTVSGG
jgi:hypothetical protein